MKVDFTKIIDGLLLGLGGGFGWAIAVFVLSKF